MPHVTFIGLPSEILEQILFSCDPIDVASFAQVSRLSRELVYNTSDAHFWRELYLAQALDDPRTAVTRLGTARLNIDWRGELQRIIRARTVVNNIALCRPHERCTIIQTLLDMVCNVRPSPYADSDQISDNIEWVKALLGGGYFLHHRRWQISFQEEQLRAHLHTCFGLTHHDTTLMSRTESRAIVYNLQHYGPQNEYGPYMMDGSGRVDWVIMQAIHHVLSMHLYDANEDEEDDFEYDIFPMSLPYVQSIIPRGLNLDEDEDWADVEGLWQIAYCFMDHRDLLRFNNYDQANQGELNYSVFEGEFEETYRTVDVYFRVINVEPDPAHPTRPVINYVGEMDGHFTVMGWVKLTPDNQIRWHFVAGEHGQFVWSGDAIQVGNVRSPFGVCGAWTTVFHDPSDPIGPFYMQRNYSFDDDYGMRE
ncbi:hypothetical protein SERLA73DRAFT_171860 [Serpula lacrymans var. lacrymans S7.3]|uniref:F-box domain-containing protein n=2 Tax=Serpula lacrymans var. lacrymans TaxID=341189 RepID=F8QD11_SERL3|nr:uncharacterized protein SERLADRAFT_479886 [Serpula lacrymans var. lacrymans S7.9]EGN94026.1 hypothetical protein SERLA73DRAFT_171860 [Serpula lacrymans var. lacrymans S7.3]EGO19380.1 hypothetical protein SERLADRAFT_479886 [Serpula lacrymans var. lacrymans S7.9]